MWMVTAWPKKPVIYQINTWIWLDSLSRHYKRPITLENVPDKVLDELKSYNVDVIWMMGVWQRSHAARASALNYQHEYRHALPDITPDDVVASPFAVGSYQVDEHLGGRIGLALFRKRLRDRGLKLILDYVPNHVATDHAWIKAHPEYMVQGKEADLHTRSSDFFAARDFLRRDIVVAHGRDPYFPGWIDTAQLNAFHPGLRKAMLNLLLDIASQCDGVRCDMAMLLVNDVFANVWRGYVGSTPDTEFWNDLIPAVKHHFPDFTFIAEVYWDMEAHLHHLGFDYCYDKRLYDRIREQTVPGVQAHLVGPTGFQQKLVRFIENHDEPRAASALGINYSYPAAVMICTLPGATLLHDGQFIGRKVKLPVQIGRQPNETPNKELRAFYLKVLAETRAPIYQEGVWWLFHPAPAHPDGSHQNLVAYGWRAKNDLVLVVCNLKNQLSRGHILLNGWPELHGRRWQLTDALDGAHYERDGNAMQNPGLYVELDPFQSHIFHFRPC
jgi:hypothetical protein